MTVPKALKEFLAEDCEGVRRTLLEYANDMTPGIAALKVNKTPTNEQLTRINLARLLLGRKPIRR